MVGRRTLRRAIVHGKDFKENYDYMINQIGSGHHVGSLSPRMDGSGSFKLGTKAQVKREKEYREMFPDEFKRKQKTNKGKKAKKGGRK